MAENWFPILDIWLRHPLFFLLCVVNHPKFIMSHFSNYQIASAVDKLWLELRLHFSFHTKCPQWGLLVNSSHRCISTHFHAFCHQIFFGFLHIWCKRIFPLCNKFVAFDEMVAECEVVNCLDSTGSDLLSCNCKKGEI